MGAECRSEDLSVAPVGPHELARDAAIRKDHDSVGYRHEFLDLTGRDHYALAGLTQLEQQFVNGALGADVHAAGRLVEQQHVRVAMQPACQQALLLVAAAVLGNVLVGSLATNVEVVDQ